MPKGVVAIVGRQNVGKSTLLNRIAGKPVSIVAEKPGTTRDRIFADAAWGGKDFTIIDTGGLMPSPESALDLNVIAQVDMAVDEADVIIFLTDARDGRFLCGIHPTKPAVCRETNTWEWGSGRFGPWGCPVSPP